MRLRRDLQRRRVPLPVWLEAGARMAFGYARNQGSLRDRRPPARFVRRNVDFIMAGRRQAQIEGRMAGLDVLLPTADLTIARSVYASGDWDPLLVRTAFDALKGWGYDHRGSTFLEVGANFGVYSLPAVSEYGFARAIAYEPDPGSFELLSANIARNGLEGRVAAHNAALSGEPGELTMSLGIANSGDNRIVETDGAAGRRATVRVPARTFDGEVAAGRIPMDELGLAWIDVQGHEPDVLAGGQTLLESSTPIVLEYSSAMLAKLARERLVAQITCHFDALVDLGWSSLTRRITYQPADAILDLVALSHSIETDLLLLHRRPR
ncbi:MAG: FkbM family methyltransferase [Candidatus Limnocylindrales bacterium]